MQKIQYQATSNKTLAEFFPNYIFFYLNNICKSRCSNEADYMLPKIESYRNLFCIISQDVIVRIVKGALPEPC